jgi:hypothetical protein
MCMNTGIQDKLKCSSAILFKQDGYQQPSTFWLLFMTKIYFNAHNKLKL